MRTLLAPALALLLATSGCRSKGGSPGTEKAPPGEGGKASLALVAFNDAPLEEVAEFFHTALKKPVQIEADAKKLGSCARISVNEPDPMPPRNVLSIIDAKYRPLGLSITDEGASVVIRRLPGAELPERCRPGSAASTTPPPPLDPLVQQAVAGIRRASPTDIEITEPTRELIYKNPDKLLQPGRLAPDTNADGKGGMRLFGVRSGSVIDALGLLNGDRILSVDDKPVSSMEQARAAFEALKTAREAKVRIERQGKEHPLTYRFVPK